MQAGKKKSFEPFEVSIPTRELEESSAWEVIDGDDPDVDLAPSSARVRQYDVDAESCVVRIVHPAFRGQGAEPLDIDSFMRPRKPAISSRHPTVPDTMGKISCVRPIIVTGFF